MALSTRLEVRNFTINGDSTLKVLRKRVRIIIESHNVHRNGSAIPYVEWVGESSDDTWELLSLSHAAKQHGAEFVLLQDLPLTVAFLPLPAML